jgi:hypothetical protein
MQVHDLNRMVMDNFVIAGRVYEEFPAFLWCKLEEHRPNSTMSAPAAAEPEFVDLTLDEE